MPHLPPAEGVVAGDGAGGGVVGVPGWSQGAMMMGGGGQPEGYDGGRIFTHPPSMPQHPHGRAMVDTGREQGNHHHSSSQPPARGISFDYVGSNGDEGEAWLGEEGILSRAPYRHGLVCDSLTASPSSQIQNTMILKTKQR